jgi:hypothetical protein
MSSINDALKRAKELQKQQAQSPPPSGVPPMSPIEPESRGGTGWLLLIVLLIAIAFFFIGLAFATRKTPVEAKTPVLQTQYVQVVSAPVPPQPAPAATAPTNAIVAPPKPVPPALQLEGILFGSGQPQAIVNGQTVYVGDSVNGFHVKAISKTNVLFVASDGTEKKLSLGE